MKAKQAEKQKLVRLRYSIDVDVMVPHSWTKEDIEFHRNESTWCADNAVAEIRRHASKDGGDCLCHRLRAEFVGTL